MERSLGWIIGVVGGDAGPMWCCGTGNYSMKKYPTDAMRYVVDCLDGVER